MVRDGTPGAELRKPGLPGSAYDPAMNRETIEKVANAVLYEGYTPYPSRASTDSNRQRFDFGVLYPEGFGGSMQRTECLVCGDDEASIDVTIRYLRLDASQRTHERAVEISGLTARGLVRSPRVELVDAGELRISAEPVVGRCHRLRIEIRNTNRREPNAPRDEVLLESMISVHTILGIQGGSFPSLLDPPPGLEVAARLCRNAGVWPVLVGEEGSHDAMLSCPIVLHDYPRVAQKNSPMFDGTEVDEILMLRMMTLAEDEKTGAGRGDELARLLLEQRQAFRRNN